MDLFWLSWACIVGLVYEAGRCLLLSPDGSVMWSIWRRMKEMNTLLHSEVTLTLFQSFSLSFLLSLYLYIYLSFSLTLSLFHYVLFSFQDSCLPHNLGDDGSVVLVCVLLLCLLLCFIHCFGFVSSNEVHTNTSSSWSQLISFPLERRELSICAYSPPERFILHSSVFTFEELRDESWSLGELHKHLASCTNFLLSRLSTIFVLSTSALLLKDSHLHDTWPRGLTLNLIGQSLSGSCTICLLMARTQFPPPHTHTPLHHC